MKKHVFVQDCPSLAYMALGDTAVRLIAIHYLICKYRLDAIVVPPQTKLKPLWRRVLGERVVDCIPPTYRRARISRPTSLDWNFGSAAWNVFESVMWESGFFDTSRLMISPPQVFPWNAEAKALMIYPEERTDGNRVLTGRWWCDTVSKFRDAGFKINALWSKRCDALYGYYDAIRPDREFENNLDGLSDCILASSIVIGGSTGPSWACLMSGIPQIVIETKKSPHGYWFFDRCKPVIAKKIHVLNTIEAILHQVS